MYVLVRKSRLAGDRDAVAQRARDHLIPLAQGRAGLKGYCGFISEAGNAYLIGVFGDRDTARTTHQRVEQWIGSNLGDMMPGDPEIFGGDAVFHEVAQPQEQQKDRQPPLFVVVRTYHGLPGQTETMHSLVSEHTLPTISGAPGFRGFYAFRDEDDPNRAISVTLFDSREEALHSHAEVIGIMRGNLGELAYETPGMEGGETIFLAAS
jgi:hypothetical protein